MKMKGVREYAENDDVELLEPNDEQRSRWAPSPGSDRYVIRAWNEGGHNCVEIDVLDLVAWLKKHRPDLLS